MEDLNSWLSDGKPEKKTKFINQRLKVGEEYIGIYKGVEKAVGRYGNTLHYIFYGDDGDEIFDCKNPKIAAIFMVIPFDSRVNITRVVKNRRETFEVKKLSSPEDEKFEI